MYYHASPAIHRLSILAHGLDYSRGFRQWEDDYPDGIYLWDDMDKAISYAVGMSDQFDIWAVDVSHVLCDPITKGAFYMADVFPANLVMQVRGQNGLDISLVESVPIID